MSRSTRKQLDLFADSADVMLRNDLIDAMTARSAGATQVACDALQASYPNDPALGDARCVLKALGAEVARPFVGPTEAAAALAVIEGQLAPAVRRLLGMDAGAKWLRSCWRDLALRSAPLRFAPAEAQTHSAALWLRAGDWAAAAAAVEAIESWRRVPVPLAWMVQARWHLLGADAIWPLLAELAWLAPQRLPALLLTLPDTRLHRLAQRFEAEFASEVDLRAEPGIWAWLPAWALADDPQLARPMAGAEAAVNDAPYQGYALMQSLIHLERQGRHHDVVAARQRLRGVSTELFTTYMRVR